MKHFKLFVLRIGFMVIVTTAYCNQAVQAADNMRFYGALVEEPCTIQPGDEDIKLDFGTIAEKYLYQHGRTNSELFQLRLSGCDISVGKSIKLTFSGIENTQLPGLLALGAGSLASGIAIGMETAEGKRLPLNKEGDTYPLKEGETLIELKAYVQAEPAAIANQTIKRGTFHAVATFNLNYD
ncbi:Major MR/P fimbria protein precursor [Photorhabdus australis subsp. thailandensis]|uniref:Major MR/P fimbria protein n=1 Tax=Photorhabdus australis subsp. thailandensis TaxID=2805096 RepID=A0A1C0U797_9GAMM|nr:fimbrial protein [Photorhabdus australis]OCQ53798.1 Major MR/P fimbria protein precursor [Photorhabdus australis subsp. thailandensis]